MFKRKERNAAGNYGDDTFGQGKVIEPPEFLLPEEEPTPAREWRQGAVVQFPSLMKARLRPITWEVLAENGDVPEELMGVVADFIEGDEKATFPTHTLDDRKKFFRFMRVVAKRMFIEPEVVDADPKEGQILASEIEQGDLQYLWLTIGHGVQVLKSFRLESTAALLSLVTEQIAGENAERNSGTASES